MLYGSDIDEYAYGEDGRLEPIQQFDFDSIDPIESEELNELTPQEIEAACRLFKSMLRWIWKDGTRNQLGILLRSIAVCWIMLPELNQHSLTHISHQFGRYKQSLGRQVDDFKLRFPMIRTPHIKPLQRTKPNE